MRTLKGAVKLTALFINRAADLASISTARNSFTLSQPEESMRPVHKMVLTRIMPNSVTSSHIWTKHMFSRFGNLMGPKKTSPRNLNGSLLASKNYPH